MSDADLIELAIDYRRHSYSPYSHFPVGAAVLMESGRVFGGCNIENASYPLSNCAERTAIFKALSEGERGFKALVVVADTERPCSPFRIPRIIMANLKGDVEVVSWEDLLPYAFSGDALSQ